MAGTEPFRSVSSQAMLLARSHAQRPALSSSISRIAPLPMMSPFQWSPVEAPARLPPVAGRIQPVDGQYSHSHRRVHQGMTEWAVMLVCWAPQRQLRSTTGTAWRLWGGESRNRGPRAA